MEVDETFDAILIRKAQDFVSLIYENKNICAKDFPSESELIKLGREINLHMRKFTSKTRSEILRHELMFF
jgi:hypothetical protein